ncbi:alpha/beta fold hydrolase [Mycetocola spongiae]|uniref:alpha/beta fold hydrolase n=1 Tax=Mycetocola spongiae TaxID=2859226 RepID=UPI001CF4365C
MFRQARLGTKTELVEGGRVEYLLTNGAQAGPLIVCENGLGSPLESWDWFTGSDHLKDHKILAYNRAGYGASRSNQSGPQFLANLLAKIGNHDPLVFVTHSLGVFHYLRALPYCGSLLPPVLGAVIVDGTDATQFQDQNTSIEPFDKVRQALTIQCFSALIGTALHSPALAREVSYRGVIQRSFIDYSVSPRTAFNARAEFSHAMKFPPRLPSTTIPTKIISAEHGATNSAEHLAEQIALSRSLHANKPISIRGATHRSILGDRVHANAVAKEVSEFVVSIRN